jgi:hypothetical protein
MRARSRFKFPGDGQWHKLPEFGPIIEIRGGLDVMVDIDDQARGRVRAADDGAEHEVDYVIGAPV